MTDRIEPFELTVPDADLDDLRRRLSATRWPDAETPDDWSQGTPLAYMQEICGYWGERYDWRRCERMLNGLGQFRTAIDGLDVHFLHVRSPHADALPLVLTHGWPGSVIEFHKVIGPLTDPTAHGGDPADAFHVVAPSLPGFGFSGKPTAPGWTVEKIGGAWTKLMAGLGYDRYVAQGGDWGSTITEAIALQDPEHCLGIHLNMVRARPDPDTMDDLTDMEEAALRLVEALPGLGFWLLEATKHPAADRRLRPGRFADRPGRLDPGEVLVLDRLRRPSGERADPRRVARQRHALLAARHRRLLGPDLLGELRQDADGDHFSAGRLQHLP